MSIVGYGRVSGDTQERYGNGLDVQKSLLAEAGATKIYCEAYTGTKRHRPELDKLLAELKPGDTLVVTKMDRIARSAKDGIDIIDTVLEKGCSIRILNMGMFDNTPTGKLMRTVMLGFAEFERDMIVQRTQEGKAAARQKEGWREGRKQKEIFDFEKFFQKQKDGELSVAECCRELNISRSTWYNRVRTME